MELLDGAFKNSENSVQVGDVTLDVDTCNSEVKEYLKSRKDNTFSVKRSITSWLQRCEGEDAITDVDIKPMPDNKCINRNLSDLAKDLDNVTLRTKQNNDKI